MEICCENAVEKNIKTETGNISQLLQSLDDDADITNGISIPSSVGSAASLMDFDFTMSSEEFESTYQSDVNTLTASTSAGERDFVDRDTAEYSFQHFLDTGDPGVVDMYCETVTIADNCTYFMTCVPSDASACSDGEYDSYYEADDGTRFYFDCSDISSIQDAADALAAHCTN